MAYIYKFVCGAPKVGSIGSSDMYPPSKRLFVVRFVHNLESIPIETALNFAG